MAMWRHCKLLFVIHSHLHMPQIRRTGPALQRPKTTLTTGTTTSGAVRSHKGTEDKASHASSSGQPPSMSAGGQAASSTLGNPQPSSSGSGAATPAHQSGQVVLLLPDHQEQPPKPTRRKPLRRKLTDYTSVQLQLDGVLSNPVTVVDNRPPSRTSDTTLTTSTMTRPTKLQCLCHDYGHAKTKSPTNQSKLL